MMRVGKDSIIRFTGRDGKFFVFQHRCHEKNHQVRPLVVNGVNYSPTGWFGWSGTPPTVFVMPLAGHQYRPPPNGGSGSLLLNGLAHF